MASIETDTTYTLKLTEREYNILYDSLDYTINSISSVQRVSCEYTDLREEMRRARK